MRKQNLCIFIFQKLFIIAVTDNTTDCFVKGCLMLRLSKTVKKDKISIRKRKSKSNTSNIYDQEPSIDLN